MYENEIAAGVALLDKKIKGWRQEIDRQRLDMSNGADCILGQLYGGYFKGIEKLFWTGYGDRAEACIAHGFQLQLPGNLYPDYEAMSDALGILTQEWLRELEK